MNEFHNYSKTFQGYKISPATVAKANAKVFQNLGVFETDLQDFLAVSSILHFDETGVRCQKKTHWIHVSSSLEATFYHAHEKRGRDGMVAGGVIDRFNGTGIHDGLKSYFSFQNMKHALCNAHHLRELKFIHEHEGEEWADQMRRFLLYAKEEAETHHKHLPEACLSELTKKYASIVMDGLLLHAQLPPLPVGKRGRRKQRPGKNLLDRLADGIEDVLRFIKDLTVPFTNNLAERDLRMIKVQQKVSGCFREPANVTIFCRMPHVLVQHVNRGGLS